MNDATDSCPLQAVEARRHDARAVADSASSEPEMLDEKSCRAAGDHRHPAIPGGQPVEGVEGRRERSGLAGVVDDGCQRPVEVDQHAALVRVLA